LVGIVYTIFGMNNLAEIAPCSANLKATAILDTGDEEVKKVVHLLVPPSPADRPWLQKAHACLVEKLRPVYSVNEWQPASATLRNGRGSCSQRMACLEAVGRAALVPTRVRALQVKGSFWYPRFRYLRFFIPQSVLLLWPQFFLENKWVDFDELYAPLARLATTSRQGFANDAESLFEAVRNTPVDFLGKTCGLSCAGIGYDLSKFVLADRGFFNTRDEALTRFGSFQHTFRGHAFELLFGNLSSC
jgi:Transglutaminase-like superfamily